MTHHRPLSRQAFSLVELSVALAIIGLLVGGIMAGQSILRGGQIRAVAAEYAKYTAAIRQFDSQFNALPGDMAKATILWGKDNVSCSGDTGSVAVPGTCNGDGDGIIERSGSANATSEAFRFWQHLALAGMIEGSFSGNAGPDNEFDVVKNVNVPDSKLADATWYVYGNSGTFSGDSTIFDDVTSPFLQVGIAASAGTDNAVKALTTSEMQSLDQKLDDGFPGLGDVRARHWGDCTTATTSAGYATAQYNKSNDGSLQCVLQVVNQF